MGAHDAAYQVMCGLDVGDPVADALVDGVFQSSAARRNRSDLSAKQPHAEDVKGLPADVLFAHVDDAFLVEHGAYRGGRHTVLTGAGLRDDAVLSHALGQKRLSQSVVDLVRAGVGKVLSLEVDLRSAKVFGKVPGVVKRRGSANVVRRQRL